VSRKFARVLTGRGLAAAAVAAVAAVAGYASYTHIEALAAAHGATPAIAHMMPVSVDGLIIASSAALLTGAGHAVARLGLALGIVATLYANVETGIRYGVVGALVALWPAVAFIVASEILLGTVRRAGATPAAIEAAGAVSETVTEDVPDDVPAIVPADVPETTPAAEPVGTVYPVPAPVPPTVAARAPRRAPAGKSSLPEKVFAAEVGRGELPSLRAIKQRARCGTDRARAIRDDLARLIEEERPEAA
jgi:hypothetical protein